MALDFEVPEIQYQQHQKVFDINIESISEDCSVGMVARPLQLIQHSTSAEPRAKKKAKKGSQCFIHPRR